MSDTPNILIVEDDPVFRRYLKELLNHEGYQPQTVECGRKAIEYLTHHPVDLALLDMGLPDMDGSQILDHIKPANPDIRFIILTGDASIESAVDLLHKGAYDYLRKPFRPKILLKKIENALEQKRLEKERSLAEQQFRKSEKKYRQLFESVTDTILILDAETSVCEEVNQAGLDLFGYSKEEFLTLTAGDLSSEKEKTQNAIDRIRGGEQGSRYIPMRFLKKKDGTIFPGEISVAAFSSDERKKIIASIRDVTEPQQVKEDLKKSRQRLHHLLSSSPAVIYAASPADKFAATFVSKNIQARLGYQSQDFIEDPAFWANHIHPQDLPRVRNRFSNLSEGKIYVHEYRFQHKNGSYRWLRDEFRLVCNEQGLPIELVGSCMDISDRKQAEKARLDSQQEFRDLVENSLVGISIIQNDRFVYQNLDPDKKAGSLVQQTISELLEIVHPDDIDKIKAAYASIRGGEVRTVEEEFRCFPSGDLDNKVDMRWIYSRATAFRYRGEDAILVNVIDTTKSKQMEQQLIIRNKMLSLGRVAAGIAHEIRNPLTGINSYLYTLDDLCHSETLGTEDIQMMQQIVEQIQVASNKIESVIKRVMDFSKPGAPRMVLSDLNASIEEALKLSAVTMRKNGLKIQKSLNRQLPQCFIDPHMMEQVVLNLITNAAKSLENSNGNKIIEITSFSLNNMLYLQVSDSGPGVPLKYSEKIFDPFFTTREDGSGIGLNIAQRIIADHNGSITLGKSKWGGAEFRIELPIERRMSPR